MTLAGKTVLITGGGSGVGADLARGFAEAGASVIIAGRRMEALEMVASTAPAIRAIPADVTDEASVKALFDRAGAVQIIIANAGAAESAPLARTSLELFERMIAVNLTGTFLTLREGVSRMEGWGRLIAISSLAGLRGYGYVSAYAAAKHGVVGLVRSLALEVAKKDITANAICPGYLDTEMTARTVVNIMEKTGRSREEALAALTAENPQGRLIAPAEVTAAALFLCSEAARSINGETIAMGGGEA